MKQRILALLLALGLLAGITGCGNRQEQTPVSSAALVSSASAADGQPGSDAGSPSETADLDASGGASEAEPGGPSSSAAQRTSAPGKVTSTPQAIQIDGTASVQKPPVTSTHIPEKVPTAHQAVKKTAYYGYCQLNAAQKKLYDKIDAAVYSLQNEIGVFDTLDNLLKAFSYYLADHPQCFWLDRNPYRVTSNYRDYTLYLAFLDGAKKDTLGENIKWTVRSDHKKIESQIAAYQKQVAAVVGGISPALTAVEKEKKIHDYILQRVTYPQPIPNEKHVYTGYGALMNKKAVCEGYAKLFQHLCYEVGINCLQATGYGITEKGRETHMWNLVQLDGDWYQVDVTWDDTLFEKDNLLIYPYFNLTDRQMYADHTVGIEGEEVPSYPLPACTATKYYFYSGYCISVPKSGQLPADAADKIRRSLEMGHLYVEFQEKKLSNQSVSRVRSSLSSVLKSIDSSRSLENQCYPMEDGCHVLFKIK